MRGTTVGKSELIDDGVELENAEDEEESEGNDPSDPADDAYIAKDKQGSRPHSVRGREQFSS